MVKVAVRLDKRHRLKDGTFPLKLAIVRNNTSWIPLGESLREEDWNTERAR